MSERTPYIGFGNDQLAEAAIAPESGDVICPRCGSPHPIEWGTSDGKPTRMLGFVRCDDTPYLVAVAGKLVDGIKPSVRGHL